MKSFRVLPARSLSSCCCTGQSGWWLLARYISLHHISLSACFSWDCSVVSFHCIYNQSPSGFMFCFHHCHQIKSKMCKVKSFWGLLVEKETHIRAGLVAFSRLQVAAVVSVFSPGPEPTHTNRFWCPGTNVHSLLSPLKHTHNVHICALQVCTQQVII